MASSLPKARRIIAKAIEVGCDFGIKTDENGKANLALGPNNKTADQLDCVTDMVPIGMAMPRLYAALIEAALENEQSVERAA